MTPGAKIKVTFRNHVRMGTLHGEVIEVTSYEIRLKQFTEDELITTIKRKQIISYENLHTI